jgi:dolichol-phosphate mannosyltransferase
VSTIVVLPTYNERENIEGILTRLHDVIPDARLMVVDDNSPDGTAQVAEELASRVSRIEVIRRASKDGLGSAYRFAFSRLFDDRDLGADDVVVTMDSDFSHDPAVIPSMLASIVNGADAVVGSRYVSGGGTSNWPLHRRLLSRWGNAYTGWILGVEVRDCTSGFRAYRLGALRAIEPQSTRAEGYAFLTELVVRLVRSDFTIEEVPILFTDRTAGTSKMSARIIVESMTLVTKWGVARRLRRAVPMR